MAQALDQLAVEMFRTFARMEYALKAAGFHNGDGAAEPNWRSFAQSISDLFEETRDPDLDAAVRYIFDHPPKADYRQWGLSPGAIPCPIRTCNQTAW